MSSSLIMLGLSDSPTLINRSQPSPSCNIHFEYRRTLSNMFEIMNISKRSRTLSNYESMLGTFGLTNLFEIIKKVLTLFYVLLLEWLMHKCLSL